MKNLLLIAALFVPGLINAITPENIIEEFKVNPGKSGGVYYAYPVTEDSVPAFPEGYEPVYISHYGRHGSRWAINEKQYPYVIDIMEKEREAGNLTEEGERTLRNVKAIADHAEGHGGELSPLGQRQHKAIARRMLQRTPGLFADSARISALSSIVPRCIISMAAFSESLKDINPALQISRSASPGDMAFISFSTPEAKKVSHDTLGWRADHIKFRENVVPKERLMKLLFKKNPELTDPTFFLKTLHDIAVTTQNVELYTNPKTGEDIDLLSIFTPEELFGFWQAINYNMYVRHANSPEGKTAGMHSARSLLDDIIIRADKALSSEDGPDVQLRFGHDTNLIRLLALMRLDGFSESETDPYKYYAAWQDYKVSPMGANLQLIFFKPVDKKSDKETLLLILHNERPVTVPLQSDKAPFYRWNDLKTLWTQE